MFKEDDPLKFWLDKGQNVKRDVLLHVPLVFL